MRYLALLFIASVNIFLFQNCSGGFQTMQGLSSSELPSNVAAGDIAVGKSLYQANCVACHGPVESSQKIGTNAFALTQALQNIPQMKHLKFSDVQIASIVLALTPPKDDSVPGTAQLKYACANPTARGASNPGVRRLSRVELQKTVRSILGATLAARPAVATALTSLPFDEVLKAPEDFPALHPSEYAVALQSIADDVVARSVQDAATRTLLFGACANVTPVTDACVDTFVKTFGAKVFRRPLTTAEVTKFKKIYTDAGGQLVGLNSAIYVFLQSPPMALHLELGSGDTNNRARLTDYEVASRISYLTISSPPDADLLAAASRFGELQSLTEVKKHVIRLLDSKNVAARERMSTFMKYYGGITEIEDPNPALGRARGITVRGLGSQMIAELGEFADGVFWASNGTFEYLMTSRDSFPRSETMRSILGAAQLVASDNKAVQADADHIGFIHRPAFLASAGARTTPILRGAHLRNHILCDAIPLPPSGEVDDQIEELGNIENQTNRAKITQLTASQACIGCHSQINPVGFTFEGFDQLGFTRTQESIYTDAGVLVTNWPINTSVQQPKLEASEPAGANAKDSVELAYQLSKGSKARSCFAQKVFEFTRARNLAAAVDGCALRESEVISHKGTLRDVIIEAIANEDIFWRKLN